MTRSVLFPYVDKYCSRNSFAFAIEMARRIKADLLVLCPVGGGPAREQDLEKHRICCRLLALKGHYHGRFNRWKAFRDVKIRILFSQGDLSAAIISVTRFEHDPVLLLPPEMFLRDVSPEEFLTVPCCGPFTLCILPESKEFAEPSRSLGEDRFLKLKRSSFNGVFSSTRILHLPGDSGRFRRIWTMRRAV